jgi:hypothetical protein
LANELTTWKKISLEERSQSYVGLPESVLISPNETQSFQFSKGEGFENLLILMPDNRTVISDTQHDSQGTVVHPSFGL